MKKRKLGQTHSLSVLITIALALFNLGLFGVILLSGNQLSRIIRQNFEVQVFLQKEVTSPEAESVRNLLLQKPFVASEKGKPGLRFVSKQEAGEKFMQETGENFAQFLGENPLRDAFTLKIEESYLEPGKLKAIKQELSNIPGVFEVVYVESLIGSIQQNLAKVTLLFSGISILLIITVVWLIRNTVRLSIYAQRFLIRSMQLVGAESWFIQRPFVWNILRHGLGAGFLAAFLLVLALHYARTYFPPVNQVLVPEQVGLLLLGIIGFGGLLAGLCAFLSVRSFLSYRMDDLY